MDKLKQLEVEFKKIDLEDQIMARMRQEIYSILKKKETALKLWRNHSKQNNAGFGLGAGDGQEHMWIPKFGDQIRPVNAQELAELARSMAKKQVKRPITSEKGLTMSQWVRAMLRILVHRKEYQLVMTDLPSDFYDLIFGLCQLFQEFDINEDGLMEWSELIQFLLDTIHYRDMTTFDLEQVNEEIKSDKDDSSHYKSNLSKITGKSDFSYVSNFSKVNEMKE